MSRSCLLLLLLLPLLLAGCGPDKKLSMDARATPNTVDVRTALVSYSPLHKTITLVGQVNPTEAGHADITSPLQGIVIQPLVKAGEHVRRGALIAEINNVYGQTPMQLQQKLDTDRAAVVSAQNALQQAIATLGQARATLAQARTTLSQSIDNLVQGQAELSNATVDLHRKQQLKDAGVYAQADVDDAGERLKKARAVVDDMAVQVRTAKDGVNISRSNVAPDQANVKLCQKYVDLAQRQVDHDEVISEGALSPVGSRQTQFYVRSPIAGTVTTVNMSAGLAVNPGTVIASVVDTRTVYVDANAYENDLQGVHVGDPIHIQADGFPNEPFSGRVSAVGQQVDPNTRTVAVRCLIQNRGDALRPGLFVQAVLTSPRARQALTVPNSAVLLEGQDHYVVVETADGRFEKRIVHEGIRTETDTEILSGLKPGEKVVTQGNILVVQQ